MHPVRAGHRLEGGQRLGRGGAQALVATELHRVPGGIAVTVDRRGVDRGDLGVEAPLGPGLGPPLLGTQPEGVGGVAGDAPLVGDALGALELRGHLVAAEVGLRDRHAEPELLGGVGSDRDASHRLHTGRHGHVHRAGGHQTGGQVGGLLARPALGVDRGGGGGQGQAGRQPGGAADVEGLLANLRHTPRHQLSDRGRVDPGALDQGGEGGTQEVGGMHGRKTAVAAADWGSYRVDDDHVRHGVMLVRGTSPTVRAPPPRRRRVASPHGLRHDSSSFDDVPLAAAPSRGTRSWSTWATPTPGPRRPTAPTPSPRWRWRRRGRRASASAPPSCPSAYSARPGLFHGAGAPCRSGRGRPGEASPSASEPRRRTSSSSVGMGSRSRSPYNMPHPGPGPLPPAGP